MILKTITISESLKWDAGSTIGEEIYDRHSEGEVHSYISIWCFNSFGFAYQVQESRALPNEKSYNFERPLFISVGIPKVKGA